MTAQAKPSVSYDSHLTPASGSGSSFVSQIGTCAAAQGCSGSVAAPVDSGSPSTILSAAYSEVEGGNGCGQLPLGLYVHVPFCSSTCDFCAFYQEKPKRQSIDLYLDAVAAELAQVRCELGRGEPWLWQGEALAANEGGQCGAGGAELVHGDTADVALDVARGTGQALGAAADAGGVGKRTFTVFFGGGTPGLLPAADLGRLCAMVRDTLSDFGQIVEWSIELAPATVRPDRVNVLLEHGVTRFSLGVQSFSDELLDALGRQHSRKQIFAAFETLRACGAKNINCDLMFALPGQTREAWLTDLQTLAGLAPEHISTYCLTFEEDTAMWVKLSQGRYKLDPEREADLYRETWAWLANAGYAQYEVSNFAREGFRSRHNLGTWSMGRWRGVGPSAASQWGGWRFQNPANLEGWAGAVLSVNTPKQAWPPVQSEERVLLTNRLLAADALIFGLRRRDGVNRAEWFSRFAGGVCDAARDVVTPDADAEGSAALPLAELKNLFERFNREALLDAAALAAGVWRLNDEGLLLADAVGGQLLECFETE